MKSYSNVINLAIQKAMETKTHFRLDEASVFVLYNEETLNVMICFTEMEKIGIMNRVTIHYEEACTEGRCDMVVKVRSGDKDTKIGPSFMESQYEDLSKFITSTLLIAKLAV